MPTLTLPLDVHPIAVGSIVTCRLAFGRNRVGQIAAHVDAAGMFDGYTVNATNTAGTMDTFYVPADRVQDIIVAA